MDLGASDRGTVALATRRASLNSAATLTATNTSRGVKHPTARAHQGPVQLAHQCFTTNSPDARGITATLRRTSAVSGIAACSRTPWPKTYAFARIARPILGSRGVSRRLLSERVRAVHGRLGDRDCRRDKANPIADRATSSSRLHSLLAQRSSRRGLWAVNATTLGGVPNHTGCLGGFLL